MTSYEQLYVPFFNRIEKDAKFFSYYNLTANEALEIAQNVQRIISMKRLLFGKEIVLWILN